MNKCMVFLIVSFLLSPYVGAMDNAENDTGVHKGYFKIGPDGNKKFICYADQVPFPKVKKVMLECDINTVLGQLVRHLNVALCERNLTVDDLFLKTDSSD